MDILDIDEVLKDDSFIFLEEKNHDDVSNILQQWKINNCIRQQPELAQEQVYRLNSRTFTRPKRKTAQNLESQFSNFQTHNPNAFQQQQQHHHPQQQQQMTKSGAPMLNLEIGGLVTTMHKSFLQDTSPPSSICSSMDVSFDCMNNSLITSADFSNINFLQSTQSLDFHGVGGVGGKDMKVFDLAGKATSEGYTLIDAIRDRQTLESLTNSGDGAVIKDSQIAQIDDISLALSKTGSACSTMNNSTESVESNNRTVEMFRPTTKVYGNNNNNNNNQTMVKEDMISETTFNLVENSMTMEPAVNHTEEEEGEDEEATTANVTATLATHLNETFKKPNPLDETMLAVGGPAAGNNTFDCQTLTPDGRCETPEAAADEGRTATLKRYESTPQTSHVRYSKQHYTPSLWMGADVNLSPIVAAADNSDPASLNATRNLDDTYERPRGKYKAPPAANATYGAEDNRFAADETFSKELQQLEKAAEDMCEMRSVIDMAHAEAALLNDGYDDDEAQFERMLNQFDQVELKGEHLKMKKSLESIKKRFKYGPDKTSPHAVAEKQQSPPAAARLTNETFDRDANATYWTGSPKSSASFSSTTSPLSTAVATAAMNSSSSGERLLNRRSRLYDDFVPAPSKQTPPGSTSFTVPKANSIDAEPETDVLSATMNMGDISKTESAGEPDTNGEAEHEATTVTRPEARRSGPQARATERERERERDRDRFKTILIDRKQRQAAQEASAEAAAAPGEAPAVRSEPHEIVVPCIDAELVGHGEEEEPYSDGGGATIHRYSRRDTPPTRNPSEEPPAADEQPRPATVNPNFLTYKKLKDKPASGIGRPAAHPLPDAESAEVTAAPRARLEPRSLSRPRYISGLQKFSVVSKATSAGDLENSLNGTADRKLHGGAANDSVNGGGRSIGRPQTLYRTGGGGGGVGGGAGAAAPSELKSPMGIKSKSFHNLSNNFGYQNGANGGGAAGGGSASAFIKPKALAGPRKADAAEKQVVQDGFKVPNSKLVSGLRAPGAGGGPGGAGKRLARPSSGYYSMSSRGGGGFVQQTPEALDLESGLRTAETPLSQPRHSIATSSASNLSKGALGSLTKLTTTGTGIPKPSGLRAPSNIKRSGLPKPAASLTRR